MNWKCKLFGHKWIPVYIKGYYGDIEVKFIACQCYRCRLGNVELLDVIRKQTMRVYNTYEESYFIEDKAYNNKKPH